MTHERPILLVLTIRTVTAEIFNGIYYQIWYSRRLITILAYYNHNCHTSNLISNYSYGMACQTPFCSTYKQISNINHLQRHLMSEIPLETSSVDTYSQNSDIRRLAWYLPSNMAHETPPGFSYNQSCHSRHLQ